MSPRMSGGPACAADTTAMRPQVTGPVGQRSYTAIQLVDEVEAVLGEDRGPSGLFTEPVDVSLL